MLKIKLKNLKEVNDYLRDNKDIFHTTIIKKITHGWKKKLKVVEVAEFLVKEHNTLITISIEEDDWSESLHLALYYYERTEEYEKCIKIKKLISDIFGE